MLQSYEIIAIVFSLVFAAFFSGIEAAFLTANKFYFEFQRKQGIWSAIIIARFLQQPARFTTTILIGNTLALVVFGIFMTNLLNLWITFWLPDFTSQHFLVLVLQIILATLIFLLLAEFLPKAIFLRNPDGFLELMAIPIYLIYYLLYPIVTVIVELSKFLIVYIFKLKFYEDKQVYRLPDLNEYISNTLQDVESPQEQPIEIDTEILQNAIEFKDITVAECMILRDAIVGLEKNEDMATLKDIFLESGHSRILIYQNNLDEIVGYCHVSDLFHHPVQIGDILKKIITTSPSMLVQDLLVRFNDEKKSIALVADEQGKTLGIVTLEDVMEQIFGKIEDEYDENEE